MTQQHFAPPPVVEAPKKKFSVKRVVGWSIVGFVAFATLSSMATAQKSASSSPTDSGPSTVVASTQPSPAPTQAGTSANRTAKVGQTAHGDDLDFTVTKIRTAPSIGSSFATKKAQGVFLLIAVTVKNHSKSPQTLMASRQLAIGSDGSQYKASDEAAIYLQDNDNAIYSEINPGNQLKGTFVFDVPRGTTVRDLELHEGWTGDAVTIALNSTV